MTWVVSDVHGCYHTLVKLIDRIMVADSDAELVFVGDYFDRGLHSKKVIDYILTLDATCIRGNHDEIMDWLLNKHSLTDISMMSGGWSTDEAIMSWWFVNGLKPTLQSYGIDMKDAWNPVEWAQQFREGTPESHKLFLKNLPLCWENDTHFVCHAYIRPDEPLPRELGKLTIPQTQKEEVIWERFHRELLEDSEKPVWDKIGVFGHTPVSYYGAVAPIKVDKIRLIDTEAFRGEYLCGYCCQLDSWILQATDDKDII